MFQKILDKTSRNAKCKTCGNRFIMGENGTVNGCDNCTGYLRDKDGIFWDQEDVNRGYVEFSDGSKLTKEEAF